MSFLLVIQDLKRPISSLLVTFYVNYDANYLANLRNDCHLATN